MNRRLEGENSAHKLPVIILVSFAALAAIAFTLTRVVG